MVTFLAAVSAAEVEAQTGIVTGQVVDAGSQQPLNGAQVLIAGTGIGGITASSWRYTLHNVPADTQTVQVELIGHGRQEQEITVTAGETAVADFTLSRATIDLGRIVVTGTAPPP